MAYPIIIQGKFTADGNSKMLNIPSGVDWIETYNATAAKQATADLAFNCKWQLGMIGETINAIAYSGAGYATLKLGSVANDPCTEIEMPANTGFSIINTSENPLGAPVAITNSGGGSNAVRPVLLTGSTAGLSNGSIVRLTNIAGAPDLSGYDFAIDTIVANTSFRIASPLANAPGANTTSGFYRIVKYVPMFYPSYRYITKITQASSAVITCSTPSNYVVGQAVRIIVPDQKVAGVSIWGMTEMNNLLGTVTAVDNTLATQTVTVNIDSSSFTAFTFPTAAQAVFAFERAMIVPVGENTPYALSTLPNPTNVLTDATENVSFRGVLMAAGNNSPAGNNNDVIFWKAGVSTQIQNT